MSNSQRIAQTILAQLGGNRFLGMTGARDLVATGTGLRFRLPRGLSKNKATHCHVELQPDDQYKVEFSSVLGLDCRKIYEQDMVHVDVLRQVFTAQTGLDCHL